RRRPRLHRRGDPPARDAAEADRGPAKSREQARQESTEEAREYPAVGRKGREGQVSMRSVARGFSRTTILAALAIALPAAQTPPAFRLEETTIAQIHAAFRDGSLTCRALVEQY